jgi:hypothetical protein
VSPGEENAGLAWHDNDYWMVPVMPAVVVSEGGRNCECREQSGEEQN